MGHKGKVLILFFGSLEFFGAVCMALIVIYKQIENFLPANGAHFDVPLVSERPCSFTSCRCHAARATVIQVLLTLL